MGGAQGEGGGGPGDFTRVPRTPTQQSVHMVGGRGGKREAAQQCSRPSTPYKDAGDFLLRFTVCSGVVGGQSTQRMDYYCCQRTSEVGAKYTPRVQFLPLFVGAGAVCAHLVPAGPPLGKKGEHTLSQIRLHGTIVPERTRIVRFVCRYCRSQLQHTLEVLHYIISFLHSACSSAS